MSTQKCPICSGSLSAVPRYPRYVCRDCAARAKSKDGRPLRFANVGLSGGYVARYADTEEGYESHECYIDDTRCYADEAHFGGIVIQTAVPPSDG